VETDSRAGLSVGLHDTDGCCLSFVKIVSAEVVLECFRSVRTDRYC
jgi:hypothetical protein